MPPLVSSVNRYNCRFVSTSSAAPFTKPAAHSGPLKNYGAWLPNCVPLADWVSLVFRCIRPQFTAPLDIVVHASTQPEPFGRAIAEAMACARPVIVSAAGGAVELFTPDHDAIGVVPGDPDALAAAIARLAADPALRQRLGENARQTAVERFDRDRLGPQLMAIYQRILKRRAGSSD